MVVGVHIQEISPSNLTFDSNFIVSEERLCNLEEVVKKSTPKSLDLSLGTECLPPLC